LVDPDRSQSEALAYREYLSVQSTSPFGRTDAQKPRQQAPEAVKILNFSPNRIEMEATTDRNRVLVLLDSYYPDWRAAIDGKDVSVIGANYVYKAIELPLGHHTVSFYYQPKSFFRGLYVSLGTVLVWLLSWLVRRFFSKRGADIKHALA
jgi:uncharacterized membrane protein YfhO